MTKTYNGQVFLVPVTFGKNKVLAVLDTGSSDTWFAQANFSCLDASGKAQDTSVCQFGPAINGTFSGGTITNQNFNISYDGGEYINGILGYEEVTLAGVTVKQKVALANYGYWRGDGVSSGLVGLSYPSITDAFNGTNATADTDAARQTYDPIFTTMFKQRLIKPMFSLAYNRGSTGGYMALGGLPPVNTTGDFVSTPILLSQDPDINATANDFYTINIDDYTCNAESFATQLDQQDLQATIDSGALGMSLPTNVTNAVNAAFSPPAQLLDGQGYFVDCDATPPSLNIEINGTAFNIRPADLINQGLIDNSTGLCQSLVLDAGQSLPVFGPAFLQNVVAVFDVGAGQMRFAQRSD